MQLKHMVSVAALFISCTLFAQTDSLPSSRTVDDVEVDFLFSYYNQDGIHSAVEGGEGTQALQDAVGVVVVNVPFKDKNALNLRIGVDAYTSASTDMIDFQKSTASHEDTRAYGNVGYTRYTDKAGDISAGLGFSSEFDVNSVNFSLGWAGQSANKMYGYGAHFTGIFDQWELIYPTELRLEFENNNTGLQRNDRNTLGASVFYSAVLSKRLQIALSYDFLVQTGLLSTPFHRVYFDTTGVNIPIVPNDPVFGDVKKNPFAERDIERLPEQRIKHALSTNISYYPTTWLIFRGFARYYTDDFGIDGWTFSGEFPIKPGRFLSIYPFYRYHTQTASTYFKPFLQHQRSEEFYTTDYDLSALYSHKFGLGTRYSPAEGIYSKPYPIIKNRSWMIKNIDLRGAYYMRSDEMHAFIITASVGFIF